MTDDRTPLGTALHDRVRDEHPDLDRLVRVATTRGTRLRRRRRTVAALAVVAGVAAVAVLGSQLTGSGGRTGGQPEIATQPTPTAKIPPVHHDPVVPPGATVVFVDAPGWTCDEPADEKFGCHRGDEWVAVNWRPADERPSYLDPGKADVVAGVHTYVSEVHHEWFATVAPAAGTSQESVDEVGQHLVWVN